MMSSYEISDIIRNIKYLSNKEIEAEDICDDIKTSLGIEALIGLHLPNSSIVIKDQLSRIIKTSRIILTTIVNQAEITLNKVDDTKNGLSKINKFREKYDYYVDYDAPKAALKFYDSLKKEDYSYSEAQNLIGLSRQTISNYVINSKYGFKPKNNGKKVVTREEIYNYYITMEK